MQFADLTAGLFDELQRGLFVVVIFCAGLVATFITHSIASM